MAIKRITDLPVSQAADISAYIIAGPDLNTGNYTQSDNTDRLCILLEVSEQTSKDADTYDSKSIDYKALLSAAIIPDVYTAMDVRNQLGELKIRADIISGDTQFYGSKTMEGLNVTSAFQCRDLTCGTVKCNQIDTNANGTWAAINCGPLDIHGNSFTCGELYVKNGDDPMPIHGGAVTCTTINCASITTNNNDINAGSGKLTCDDASMGDITCGSVASTGAISGTTGTFSGALTATGITCKGAPLYVQTGDATPVNKCSIGTDGKIECIQAKFSGAVEAGGSLIAAGIESKLVETGTTTWYDIAGKDITANGSLTATGTFNAAGSKFAVGSSGELTAANNNFQVSPAGAVTCKGLNSGNEEINAGSAALKCTDAQLNGTTTFGGSNGIQINAAEIKNVGTFGCATLNASTAINCGTNNEFTVTAGGIVTCTGELRVKGTAGSMYSQKENPDYGGKVCAGAFTGTAYRALWGDIAERYVPDQPYEAGTLVKFGGEQEITLATDKANAVISDKPAFTLADDLKDAIPVALAGRVPVKVVGPICKFDRLMLDTNNPGCAILASDGADPIAVALESSGEADAKLVLCATHFNLR